MLRDRQAPADVELPPTFPLNGRGSTRWSGRRPPSPIIRSAPRTPSPTPLSSWTTTVSASPAGPGHPKVRKALIADSPSYLCSAEERGYRVFGLPDAQVEKRVNQSLSLGWFDMARKDIQRCSGVQRASLSDVARGRAARFAGHLHLPFGGRRRRSSDEAGGGAQAVDLVHGGGGIALGDVIEPARLARGGDGLLALLSGDARRRGRDHPRWAAAACWCADQLLDGPRALGLRQGRLQRPGVAAAARGHRHRKTRAIPTSPRRTTAKARSCPGACCCGEKLLRRDSKVAHLRAG